MKKLTIIFGGSVDYYHNSINLFRLVEKKTGWKLKRVSFDRFISEINNIAIDIRFCWNPVRDFAYKDLEKFASDKLKFIVHPPAKELVKGIKDTDAVLFIGHCGAFQGKKEEVYIPNEFSRLLLKKLVINKKIADGLKPEGKIRFSNLLFGKFEGKECRVITTNLTLNPSNMHNKDKDLLINVARKLSLYGDVVEKESYEIVKGLKGKYPLGVVLVSSDVLSIKKHMMKEKNFKTDNENLANVLIKSINLMIKEIK